MTIWWKEKNSKNDNVLERKKNPTNDKVLERKKKQQMTT